MRLEPLRIVAHLSGAVCLPDGTLALDALLASVVASRLGLTPPACAEDCEPIEIPIKREPDGRFHLASFALFEPEEYEVDWTNRRFPVEQAQEFRLRRTVRINAGPEKSYRLPRERMHVRDDRLTWFCFGAVREIKSLLSEVAYLGKKRNVGIGRVARWEVESCLPWGDGFPVVLDGQPLRPLPPDWSGLSPDAEQAFRVLSYPYWHHARAELCAVPESPRC